MQTTAIGTVANSLPESEVISLTLLISKRYILFAELRNKSYKNKKGMSKQLIPQAFIDKSMKVIGQNDYDRH